MHFQSVLASTVHTLGDVGVQILRLEFAMAGQRERPRCGAAQGAVYPYLDVLGWAHFRMCRGCIVRKTAMAIGNFPSCLVVTLKYEGGYSNDPNDRGNWTGQDVEVGILKGTKYGIAAHAYPHLDIKNLTFDAAKKIYERDYWKPILGDSLPYGVDLATFDAGVMSGPRRGVRWLQAAVGAKQDGLAGSETLAKTLAADGTRTIRAICASRRSFVQSLSSNQYFGRGWSRRIAEVEAKSIAVLLMRGGR
ncbi:hypothetical protein BMJ26_26160 [Sinorhizobium medicae]|nr:hypothetical protein BMJ31_25420 [Sinorhizobium medicae]PLU32721.1 hypothetical protein BMJ26_26160 [Sinorhizobium medicae]PLU56002.1 hypothetical protein BMJ24_19840 [Sinorhizobium medicae]PLU72296.1 hypothetical protein BMJ20_06620 [Sinorhizobium medicae]